MGALDGAMENFGPFDDAMGKLETLNKVTGKLGGLITWWENGKLDPWWRNGTFEAPWWCNGQMSDPSDGKIGLPDDLMGKLEALGRDGKLEVIVLMTWWGNEGPWWRKFFGPNVTNYVTNYIHNAQGKLHNINKIARRHLCLEAFGMSSSTFSCIALPWMNKKEEKSRIQVIQMTNIMHF